MPYRINRVRRYSNPYFRPAQKSQKPPGFYYSLIILCLVTAAWFYFLFASSVFRITEWEINGLKQYDKQEISKSLQNFLGKSRFLIFRNSNILLFDQNNFKKNFSLQFTFQNIKTKKYYPHKIIIDFEEKQEKIAVYNEDKIYLVSQDGTIIREKEGIDIGRGAPEAFTAGVTSTILTSTDINKIIADAKTKELPPYPIFYDAYYKVNDDAVGSAYPAEKILQIISVFIDNAKTRSDVKVKLAGLYKNNASPKIVIYMDNNWKIYLNNTDDGLKQFYKFYTVLSKKIKDTSKALEYIDLRFGDRVYIK